MRKEEKTSEKRRKLRGGNISCAGSSRHSLTPALPHSLTRRSFTLVDLLVAMAILLIVVSVTSMMFRGILRAWQRGQIRTERYQQARLLSELFTRELSCATPNPRYPLLGNPPDAEAFKPMSVQDSVFFVGTLPGRSGLVERGYWLASTGELMCHDEEPADGDYATGSDEPCAIEVRAFTVSFFDGLTWREEWDARAGGAQAARLPEAVRLLLELGAAGEEPFETVIRLPAG